MKAMIKVQSPAGFEITFETPEMENRHVLLEVLPRFETELIEAGYEPVSMSQSGTPAQPAPVNGQASFLVDKITATVDGEKGLVYWRVKGGEFQKFGVVIYPEALETAGLGELNPLKPFSEPGMIAYYSVKEDGKPKKVTWLERAGK